MRSQRGNNYQFRYYSKLFKANLNPLDLHKKDFGLSPFMSQIKIKIKLSLCLTKHHAMKANWRCGGIPPRIL